MKASRSPPAESPHLASLWMPRWILKRISAEVGWRGSFAPNLLRTHTPSRGG